MFAGPSKQLYERKWILPVGEPVKLKGVDTTGSWYMFSNRYWIPASNIMGRAPSDLPVTKVPYVSTEHKANLRQETSVVSPIGGEVSAGQSVVVIGEAEGGPPAGIWYLLDSGFWISGDLVTDVPENLPKLEWPISQTTQDE